MTTAQLKMLIELALIIHEMAPPDSQRRIDAAFTALQNERDRQIDPGFHGKEWPSP